jgi:hypothetical protein
MLIRRNLPAVGVPGRSPAAQRRQIRKNIDAAKAAAKGTLHERRSE